ncbi:RNA 2',3'-cyclic phosphodiesterase [Desulfobacterales bacterium HSG16]|nr:RNA 2',3'-cyclic phosphodiesterase [Desulfobacterales bacterium HSG16]
MTDTIRAFIAIKLPESVTSGILDLQKDLKNKGLVIKWVRPENIHLTLKFLGNISLVEVNAAKHAILDTTVNFAPFVLTAAKIGVFATVRKPRILWTGIKGDTKHLVDLQKSLDRQLAVAGFEPEKRPFKAHLTIGRFKKNGRFKKKNDPKMLSDAIMEFEHFESKKFMADRIILFKSELRPSGAVYTEISGQDLESGEYARKTP